MSSKQRMCICGHQKMTHDRRQGLRVRWEGCWGFTPPNSRYACGCEGFMWVKSKRLEVAS